MDPGFSETLNPRWPGSTVFRSRRSSRQTPIAGPRSVDRAAGREMNYPCIQFDRLSQGQQLATAEQRLLERFRSQMRQGQLVLFTGAGFSRAAISYSGRPIPGVEELKQALWDIGFPGSQYDPNAALQEIYHGTQTTAGNKTGQILKERFHIDPARLPGWYRLYFGAPWRRIFTVNVDDLEDAAARAFELPRTLAPISALTQHAVHPGTALQVVHLNGMASEYPNVTFSAMDYAKRAVGPDPWYDILVAELSDSPVVFVGTELDEQGFWSALQLRSIHGGQRPEQRPGSYLVTPKLSLPRQRLLESLNVQLIEIGADQFADEWLASSVLHAEQGHQALSRRQPSSGGWDPNLLREVGELRRQRYGDLATYLLGRAPTWHDVTEGFAVQRDFEGEVVLDRPVTILVGTAGCGRSTTLMRLALRTQASGAHVRWLDDDTTMSLTAMRRQIRDTDVDVLYIDDLQRFGEAAGGFLIDLRRENPRLKLVCTCTSTAFERLSLADTLGSSDVWYQRTDVPHLLDSDIDRLIDALTGANRLGRLRNRPRSEQRRAFQERAGRQLLVAMIEATSGERFEERIDRECQELAPDAQAVYAICALATGRSQFLLREELLLAAQELCPAPLNVLRQLRNQHLLVEVDRKIRVRHRVIARRVQRHFRLNGMLREPLIGLLWALATKVTPGTQRRSREMRLLIEFMNHSTLAELTDSGETPRLAYDRLEDALEDNYHYWLQRGSHELDHGSLQLADNYLNQAYAMRADDEFVRTAWAHKELRWAAENASDASAAERATVAIEELEDSIRRRGVRDTYPYHVLGSQGLHWSRRGVMSTDDRKRLLARLLHSVKEGASRHAQARDLQQLKEDVQREYLSMAV